MGTAEMDTQRKVSLASQEEQCEGGGRDGLLNTDFLMLPRHPD